MKTIKNLITLSIVLFSVNLITAQNACGNCNERYLKTVTFYGVSNFVLGDDLHVFYKTYTPNSRRCYSQNAAGDKMVALFEAALEKNTEYQSLVDQHEARYKQKFSRNKLVGNYVLNTANASDVLKPYEDKAKGLRKNIKYHKVDAYIEGFFQDKYLCPRK